MIDRAWNVLSVRRRAKMDIGWMHRWVLAQVRRVRWKWFIGSINFQRVNAHAHFVVSRTKSSTISNVKWTFSKRWNSKFEFCESSVGHRHGFACGHNISMFHQPLVDSVGIRFFSHISHDISFSMRTSRRRRNAVQRRTEKVSISNQIQVFRFRCQSAPYVYACIVHWDFPFGGIFSFTRITVSPLTR